MNIANSLIVAMLLAVHTTGCLNASDGTARNVPLSDFSTNPIVQIDWPEMTLTIPPSNAASVGSVSPKVKVEGESIIIEAKYVLSTKPAVTTFNLKKLGMPKEKISSAKVFWMNPDGTKHALEIKPKKASEK